MQNFFDGTFREDILLGNAFVFGDDVKKSLRVCLLCSTSPEKHAIEKHSILPWWRGILPPGAQNPYMAVARAFPLCAENRMGANRRICFALLEAAEREVAAEPS